MPAAVLPSSAATHRSRGLAGRLIGVLISPRATYAHVAERPAWLGVFVFVLAAGVLSAVWLLSTEVGRQAVVDQQLQTLEAFGRTVNDEEYRRLQAMAPYSSYFVAAGQIVGLPLAAAAVAAVAYAIFTGILGDTATFRQVFAVVISSSAVAALRALVTTPLNYARESLSNPVTVAAVLPFFEDNTFGGRLLGSIDLFVLWWIVSLAIGLGVLYKRRTIPIATTMLVVYVVVGIAIAAARSVLAGA